MHLSPSGIALRAAHVLGTRASRLAATRVLGFQETHELPISPGGSFSTGPSSPSVYQSINQSHISRASPKCQQFCKARLCFSVRIVPIGTELISSKQQVLKSRAEALFEHSLLYWPYWHNLWQADFSVAVLLCIEQRDPVCTTPRQLLGLPG